MPLCIGKNRLNRSHFDFVLTKPVHDGLDGERLSQAHACINSLIGDVDQRTDTHNT